MGRQSAIHHSIMQQRFIEQLLKCWKVNIVTAASGHLENNCYARSQTSVPATPALGLLQNPRSPGPLPRLPFRRAGTSALLVAIV